jgi:hypothetical protein
MKQFTDIRFGIVQVTKLSGTHWARNHTGWGGILVNPGGQPESQTAVDALIAK